MNINNIFCIGRNYAEHAKELGNDVPKQPIVFSKPTHALVHAHGQVIDYPGHLGAIHHELEIVLFIGKDVEDDFTVDEVVTKMALGIDLTLRDVQSKLKSKGHPWLLAKGFKNSAVITDFWDFPGVDECHEKNFSLLRENAVIQNGHISQMIFPFQSLLDYIHKNFGLKRGDLVFTGTPEGVGPIQDDETYHMYWGDEEKGRFKVHLSF